MSQQRKYRFQAFIDVDVPGMTAVAVRLDEDLLVEDHVTVDEAFLRQWAGHRAQLRAKAEGLEPNGQFTIGTFEWQRTA